MNWKSPKKQTFFHFNIQIGQEIRVFVIRRSIGKPKQYIGKLK